jgi:predicted Zn-dependent protease
MVMGRPTLYSEELADKICMLVASTDEGLDHICEQHEDLPAATTIYQWRFKYPDFSQKYLLAKKFQAELFAESTLRIAKQKAVYFDSDGNERVDAGHVAWQKLNVNTRQWHASKLAPKIYGDQKQIEDLSKQNEQNKAEIDALKARLAEQAKREY